MKFCLIAVFAFICAFSVLIAEANSRHRLNADEQAEIAKLREEAENLREVLYADLDPVEEANLDELLDASAIALEEAQIAKLLEEAENLRDALNGDFDPEEHEDDANLDELVEAAAIAVAQLQIDEEERLAAEHAE